MNAELPHERKTAWPRDGFLRGPAPQKPHPSDVPPGSEEAATVAHLVAGVLEAPDDAAAITRVAGKVKSLCDDFPVYGSA